MARVAPRIILTGLTGLLGACASQPAPRLATRTAPPPREMPAPAPTVAPGEAVWHLRAGLNVAALACRGRGRVPVAGSYARLLSRHRALLAEAYAGEQRRYGGGLDRHQTQLYNRFSNQRDPVRFCRDAASVAQRAAGMDSPALSASARSLLGEID